MSVAEDPIAFDAGVRAINREFDAARARLTALLGQNADLRQALHRIRDAKSGTALSQALSAADHVLAEQVP